MKDILFSSGVGFGIGALFTIVRLPIPVPNVLPGILSIVFMYVGYLVVKYFMPVSYTHLTLPTIYSV